MQRRLRAYPYSCLFLIYTVCLFPMDSVRAASENVNASKKNYTNNIDKILPDEYWKKFLPDAKKLAEAKSLITIAKYSSAKTKLIAAAKSGAFQDLALFELANVELHMQNAVKAQEYLQRLIVEFPSSPILEKARVRLSETEFSQADKLWKQTEQANAGKSRISTKVQLQRAATLYQRGLSRIPWKDWDEYENSIETLLTIFKETQSPYYLGFYGEALSALPKNSKLRAKLMENLPEQDAKKILNLAQHDPGVSPNGKGIKPIQPDEDLFKDAMDKVLDLKWSEALALFQTFKDAYPESAELERATYWIAACLQATGKQKEANELFRSVVETSPLSYYGLEAALRSDTDFKSLISKSSPSVEKLDGNLLPQQLTYLWRARALSQVKLFEEARQEMDALFRYSPGGVRFGQLGAKGSLALAMLFAETQYFPGAFYHLRAALQKDRTLYSQEALSLFFPKMYSSEIQTTASTYNLDPFLLYSVTKQESAFMPEARSPAKALGLMQVLLSTASEIQDNLDRKKLLEPQKNVIVGAEYLKKLILRFDGNIAIALAAYNAGPTRASRWWKDLQQKPIFASGFRADVFIDSMPIRETRLYVGSILRNYAWYKYLNAQSMPTSVEKLAMYQNEKKEQK